MVLSRRAAASMGGTIGIGPVPVHPGRGTFLDSPLRPAVGYLIRRVVELAPRNFLFGDRGTSAAVRRHLPLGVVEDYLSLAVIGSLAEPRRVR